jgi:hypothetical protein
MPQTTWNEQTTLHSLMLAFNRAKASNEFEIGRLNRALGIAMHSVTFMQANGRVWGCRNKLNYWHYFTKDRCDCADARHTSVHTGPCKHRIAAMLLTRAKEYDDAIEERENISQDV